MSETKIRSEILALRSYGPSSFASLTDDNTGSYLQVAGGGVTCMLERHDALTHRHFRAHHDRISQIFPHGTVLAFGGGEIALAADEWFTADEVLDAFLRFFNQQKFDPSIGWRELPHVFVVDADKR